MIIFKNKQRGLTLIELMVAMVLGLFLMSGAIEIFSANQRTIRLQIGLSRIQENGRFAIDFLMRDIRMAGYWGCLSADAEIENKLNADPLYDSFIANQLPPHAAGINNNTDNAPVISGTDSFQLSGFRHSNDNPRVVDQPTNRAASLKVTDDSALVQGDIVIIMNSECTSGDLFQLSNVTGGGGFDNLIHNEGNTVTPGNRVKELEVGLFSDAAGPHDNKYEAGSIVTKVTPNFINYSIQAGENGRPSLFKGNTELIEGVEDMQIVYGVDTNDTKVPNYYTTANLVGNWKQVVSIRLSLLLVSTNDNITSKAITYTYNGNTVTPTDKRLRRVFTTTVSMRNFVN